MHRTYPLILALALGCTGTSDKDDETTDDETPTGSACTEDDTWGDHAACTSWMLNSTGETAAILREDDGSAAEVDVQAVDLVTSGGASYIKVTASGIPSYTRTFTQAEVDALDARPKASTDFEDGATTAVAGTLYDFGADIGFASMSPAGACGAGEGYGWWPPGPECPSAVGHVFYVPLEPTPATTDICDTGALSYGLWVNGTAIFNWADTFAYDDEFVWQNVASVQEVYDVDVCGGHAAAGEYHHHSASPCLSEQLGDDGSGHSPIYGWIADGYPVYGPWYADGVAAKSCWVQRDYDDPNDPTGCGGTGERTCVLVDQTDPSLGTVEAAADGPPTNGSVTSLSGNVFGGELGLFYQDYWFDADCAAEGGAALDEHNGHDHDGLGYHYHITSGFPYTPGPTLHGVVPDLNDVQCTGVQQAPSGGPPGM